MGHLLPTIVPFLKQYHTTTCHTAEDPCHSKCGMYDSLQCSNLRKLTSFSEQIIKKTSAYVLSFLSFRLLGRGWMRRESRFRDFFYFFFYSSIRCQQLKQTWICQIKYIKLYLLFKIKNCENKRPLYICDKGFNSIHKVEILNDKCNNSNDW